MAILLYHGRVKATWPSGKAGACKALIPQFQSGCRLFKEFMMGRIFGISDLPVSTIMSPFEPIIIENPQTARTVTKVFDGRVDNKFLLNRRKYVSNPVLRMKYGFGKLMKHFSKPKVN